MYDANPVPVFPLNSNLQGITLGQSAQDPETAKMRQKTLIEEDRVFFIMFEKESRSVTEKDWGYPQVAIDNPGPNSDDVVVEIAALSMGSTEGVTVPLCEKRLLLGTKVVATPE